jgi:hypothetical protein
LAPQLLPAAMVAGPCCVFGATAPPASDSPPDAAAQRGAASDSLPSSDEGFSDGELWWGATAVSYTAQLATVQLQLLPPPPDPLTVAGPAWGRLGGALRAH